MSIEKLLNEEIEAVIKAMSQVSADTEEYTTMTKNLGELIDRSNKLKELELEHQRHLDNLRHESEIKDKELDTQHKDAKISQIINGVGIVVPSLITVWGTCKTFKFEGADGIFTSTIGKQYINKLLKK